MNIFQSILFYPILSDNAALRLHDQIHVDTWQWFRVMLEAILVPWDLGDVYHPLYLNLTLSCLDLRKRQESTCPDSVVCIFPEKGVPWKFNPYLLPKDGHWFSCTDFFHIFRRDAGLFWRLYLILFTAVVNFSICKAILVVHVFVS